MYYLPSEIHPGCDGVATWLSDQENHFIFQLGGRCIKQRHARPTGSSMELLDYTFPVLPPLFLCWPQEDGP